MIPEMANYALEVPLECLHRRPHNVKCQWRRQRVAHHEARPRQALFVEFEIGGKSLQSGHFGGREQSHHPVLFDDPPRFAPHRVRRFVETPQTLVGTLRAQPHVLAVPVHALVFRPVLKAVTRRLQVREHVFREDGGTGARRLFHGPDDSRRPRNHPFAALGTQWSGVDDVKGDATGGQQVQHLFIWDLFHGPRAGSRIQRRRKPTDERALFVLRSFCWPRRGSGRAGSRGDGGAAAGEL